MKNNILAGFIIMILFAIPNFGQDQSAVFPDGTTIIFENKIDSAMSGKSGAKVRVINVLSPTDNANIVHRVFVDGENKSHFGYDLEVKKVPSKAQYTVAFKPLSIIFFSSAAEKGVLPKFPEPMQINEGDSVSVDLLENPKTKTKIADVIKIIQGEPNPKVIQTNRIIIPNTPDNKITRVQTITPGLSIESAGEPKDFTIDEIRIQLINANLSLNGRQILEKKVAFGANVYFYLKGKGRFILSPVPREGYKFQKNGVIDGNKISFETGGDKYELDSLMPIICSGGKWNLWVLYEPDYRPSSESENEFGGGNIERLVKQN